MDEQASQSGTSQRSIRPNLHRAKAAVRHELQRFAIMFLYLWLMFGMFALMEHAALSEHGIPFAPYGIAILNAAVLGKVMLVAEKLRLARHLESLPLIWPILAESLMLSLLFIITHVLEHVIGGLIGGHRLAASVPAIGGGGIQGLLCIATILFVAMVPFFAFSYIARELGPGRVQAMLFGPRPAAGVPASEAGRMH